MASNESRRLLVPTAFGMTLALLLSACGTPAAPSDAAPSDAAPSDAAPSESASPVPEVEPAEVRLALPVPAPDPGQIWAFTPEGAGYFEDERLTVEVLPTEGGAANIQLVATGAAEFAISSPDNLLNATTEGLDLVAVATVVTRQIYRFVVLPDSPISGYDDLRGTTIGVSSLASGSYPFAQYALEEMGLDPATDVQFLPVGVGGPALEALRGGDVDALSTWDTQIAIFNDLGQEVRLLEETSNVAYPADFIITSRAYLEQNEEIVVRFARAVVKSIVLAQESPDCAVDFFIDQFPEAAEAREREGHLRVLEARLPNMELIDQQDGQWGRIPIDLYDELQDISLELGTIRERQDLESIMTNDLIDRITDFDVSEISTDAEGC